MIKHADLSVRSQRLVFDWNWSIFLYFSSLSFLKNFHRHCPKVIPYLSFSPSPQGTPAQWARRLPDQPFRGRPPLHHHSSAVDRLLPATRWLDPRPGELQALWLHLLHQHLRQHRLPVLHLAGPIPGCGISSALCQGSTDQDRYEGFRAETFSQITSTQIPMVLFSSPLRTLRSRPGQRHGVDHWDRGQLRSSVPRRALPGSIQPHVLLREVPHAGLGGGNEPLQDISGVPHPVDSHARRIPGDPGRGALQRLNRAPGEGENSAASVKSHPDRSALLRTVSHPPPGAECHVLKGAVWLQLRGELVCGVSRVAGADQPQLCRRPHFVLFRKRGREAWRGPSPLRLTVRSLPQGLLFLAVARRHTQRRLSHNGDAAVGKKAALRLYRRRQDEHLQDGTCSAEGGVSTNDHSQC